MSGSAAQELKATKKEFARSAAGKKADEIFGIALDLRKAVNDADSSKDSKKETRTFGIDISADMEKKLGSLRDDLARSCSAVGLTSPLPDRWEGTFDIEVTTGKAIWALIDGNKFWDRAQNEAFAACRDHAAADYLERIRKSGVDLRGQLNEYAGLAAAVQAELPEEMKDTLRKEMAGFVAGANTALESMRQRIEIDAGKEALDFIKKQLQLEKDIIKYRSGKSAIVLIDSGMIAGHIAHAAASFGATAPLAIIAIVRLVVEIVQIAAKALADLDQLEMAINKEIDLVCEYWSDSDNKKGFMAKLKASAMETMSGLLSGVTNIEFPSVQAVKTLLNDYRHKLNVLTKTYNDLGAELARLQRVMEAYTAILNKFSKRMTGEQKKAVTTLIDSAGAVYEELYGKAVGKDGKSARISNGEENLKIWTTALAKIEEVTNKYTKFVAKGAKVLTSAALGLGSLGGDLAHLVGTAVDNADMVGHLAEIASVKLEMMGDAVTVMVADAGLANLFERLAEVKD
jgi:hypothetical protein